MRTRKSSNISPNSPPAPAVTLLLLVLLNSCSSIAKPPYKVTSDLIAKEFRMSVSNYDQELSKRKKELKSLMKLVQKEELSGKEATCAAQILIEARWLLNYTSDFSRADRKIAALRTELAKPSNRRLPDTQASDGSWGQCFDEWFFKLSISADRLLDLAEAGKRPQYSPKFLDQINSDDKLTAYLNSILFSDIPTKHKFERRELNESTSSLMRLTRKLPNSIYKFDPRVRQTLLNFINNQWRDQETGYWGAWFKDFTGKVVKTTDLSITFHLVSYLGGKVSDLDKIFSTTLAIRNEDYPYGWLENGKQENHHNYDVVRLLRYGWSLASPEEKNVARNEIQKMLTWSLKESLSSEGDFTQGNSDDSIEDAYYFGVSFLDEIGFFNSTKRFWTSESLPNSELIRQKLIKKIRLAANKGGKSGIYYRSALEKLMDID
jgi:hypothetical protein